MQEIWKFYTDSRRYRKDGTVYQGYYYEVSNLGNAKRNGKIVKPINRNGYLYIGGKYIHRMVAETFVFNPENKPEVDHIDGNPLNNNANNLQWVTHKENMNNPITLQRLIYSNSGERNAMYGKNSEDYMTPEAVKEKRNKQSEALKGKQRSEEVIQKQRKTMKEKYENGYISPLIGHVFSEERNKKIGEANKGEKNGMYGKPPANKGKHFNKNTRHYE